MDVATAKSRGPRSIFDLLERWTYKLREAGQNVRALEDGIRRIERYTMDLRDATVVTLIRNSLSLWYAGTLRVDDLAVNGIVVPHITQKELISNVLKLSDTLRRLSSKSRNRTQEEMMSLLTEMKPNVSSVDSDTISRITTWIVEDTVGFFESLQQSFEVEQLESEMHVVETKPISKFRKLVTEYFGNLVRVKERSARHLEPEGATHVWEITFRLHSKSIRASQACFFIWTFTQTVELIEDVEVVISDSGVGSFWLKVKIFFKNTAQKKEVKELLEKTRDAVIAEQLDKRIGESAKVNAEAKKIAAEEALLREQLDVLQRADDQQNRDFQRRKQQLELESMELANQRQQLQNRHLALDIMERQGYLLKEGIGLNEPLEITINDQRFLTASDGKITPGASMDEIEAAEKKLPPDPRNPKM